MKRHILATILSISSLGAMAQGVDANAVNKMLKDFQAKGILNPDQAKDVEVKLNQISPDQWSQIRKQAEQMKAEGRVPATNTSNNVDAAAGMIDTSSPEFQKTMDRLKGVLQAPRDPQE